MWFKLCLCSVFFSILSVIPALSGRLDCHGDSKRKFLINSGFEINVTSCNLVELKLVNLENRTELEIISASQNQIWKLDNETFRDMENLRKIDLSQNHLETLELESFNGLKNLTEIYLNKNSISELRVGLFDELPNLRVLNLQQNEIMILEEELFAQNDMLQILLLGNNRIVAIGPTVLKHLNALEILNLTGNVCINEIFTKYEEQIVAKYTQSMEGQPTVKYSNCWQSYPVYLKLTKQYSKLAMIEPTAETSYRCSKNKTHFAKKQHLIESLFTGDHLYVIPTMFFVISFVINIILCVCFFYMFKDDHSTEKSQFNKIDPNFDPGRRVSIRALPETSSSNSDDEKTDEKSETKKLNKKTAPKRMQRRVSFDERFIRKNHKDMSSRDAVIPMPTTPE